jgi:hypothetical protein
MESFLEGRDEAGGFALKIRSFANDTNGSIVIQVALLMPIILGFGAFAIDVTYYHYVKNRLQSAADASALASVRSLAVNNGQVLQVAADFAAENVPSGFGTVVKSSDVTIGTFDTSTKIFSGGGINPNAVRVNAVKDTGHQNAPVRFLSGIFGSGAVSISTTATAVLNPPTACVIALSSNAAGSIATSGSGKISVPNCGIYSNSKNGSSLQTSNSTTITGKTITTAGGYSGSGFSPVPKTNQLAIADPLLKVPEPTIPSVCTTVDATISADITFPANSRFCGNTKITGGATVTFAPGVHFFTGGTFTLQNSSNVQAINVMFFLAKDAILDSSAGGVFKMTAPQTGTYKGIVLFQSRDTPSVVAMKLTGSKDFYMDGTVYLPKTDLTFLGSSDLNLTTNAGYVIANTFKFSGNSSLNIDSHGGAVASGLANKAVLVN